MLEGRSIVVGILALQGAFAEHQAALHRLSVKTVLVKTAEELNSCDALIIPGGESTTIALLARSSGLLDPLKEFIRTKPVWGTCAGAILMSEHVVGAKKGGQELFGGISITIARNGWGSQIESFEAPLIIIGQNTSEPFTGIFIRAPVVLKIHPRSDELPVEVVARIPHELLPISLPEGDDTAEDVVALRQGRHFLTTFHPELTKDDRLHEYFVKECVLRK